MLLPEHVTEVYFVPWNKSSKVAFLNNPFGHATTSVQNPVVIYDYQI